MIRHVCKCGRIVTDGNERCPEHRKRDTRWRTDPNQRAYKGKGELGKRWRTFRARYLRTHPTCECTDPECSLPAEHVHHLDGYGVAGPGGFDEANVEALSNSCHARLEAAQRERVAGRFV